MNDYLAVLISFACVFAILGVAEGLRRAFRFPVEFTRKFVHIGVGMWSWGTVVLFQNKWFAIIPPAAFIIINYISYRRGLIKTLETGDRSNLGTVYFPIAFTALILLFFDTGKVVFVAALMPMTWGDAFAAIVGRMKGAHKYTVFGSTRSLEGSLVMLFLSLIALWITLAVFFPAEPARLFWIALPVSVLVTVVEAISPFGLDNLLVPAAGALGIFGILSFLLQA
ncbi:MAG TPA: phosphatidate cytidylyltransferase [Anaerolineae bacterium]|jgi:dolichol kinase